MSREAQFSVTYDANESGNQDAVINAGAGRGLFVTGIYLAWQPHSMSGSSDELPDVATARYTGAASGGTSAAIFNFDVGDSPAASVLLAPTTLGSNAVIGPQFWPGHASKDASGNWYLHGGHYFAEFSDSVYVSPGNSFWVRVANAVSATIYFREHLLP